jgi:hypothetical protein
MTFTTGLLGKASIDATNADTLIYTAQAGASATASILLVNRTSNAAAVNIAIGTGAAPGNADYIEFGTTLAGNGVLERTGVVIGAGEKVFVRTTVAGVTARVHGFEEAA